jgi:hypothetical protein
MAKLLEDKIVPVREKTYKREISLAIFLGCLFWSIWSGSTEFLEITFMPTLFNLGVAMGLHEYSRNIIGYRK